MTLIELLSAVTVAAILLAIAVPSFRLYSQGVRLSDATNSLVTTLNRARSEAVTRGRPVTVCASDDQTTCAGAEVWTSGWIVFNDDNGNGSLDGGAEVVLAAKVGPAGGGSIEVPGTTLTSVTFRSTGALTTPANQAFEVCVEGVSAGRTIVLAAVGHTSVDSVDCS